MSTVKKTAVKMITVKPAKDGVQVRKQNGKLLAEEGETVQRNAFWVRRLKDGDVVEATNSTKASTTKAKTTTTEGE